MRPSSIGSKKNLALPREQRQAIIAPCPELSIRRQCEILNVHRSAWYYAPVPTSAAELNLRAVLDRIYTEHPEFGVRRMVLALGEKGYDAGPKRVRGLLRNMGLEAVYPKPRLTVSTGKPGRFPYLLRDVKIIRPHQVWAADITYIPMIGGWSYLLAIMDWFSRFVLAWDVSSTRDGSMAVNVLRRALEVAGRAPEISNTDQGSEFCDQQWIDTLTEIGAQISQDGRGRALDNRMVERLWRTVKWEHVYLHDYSTQTGLRRGLGGYFDFYNERRWHQGLGNLTPRQVLCG